MLVIKSPPLGSWPFCPSQGTWVSGDKDTETKESKLFPVSSSGDWRGQVLKGSWGQSPMRKRKREGEWDLEWSLPWAEIRSLWRETGY